MAIAPILAIGAGIAKSIFGASDKNRAAAEMAALKPVDYIIQDEYYDNRNLAASELASGLPSATKDYYTTEAQRGLGSSLGVLTQTGGVDANITNSLLDSYNRNIQSVAVAEANKRVNDIKDYIAQNSKLAAQKTMKWAIEDYQPYQRKLKQLYQRQQIGEANMWGGIGDAITGASAYETSKVNEDLLKTLKTLKGNNNIIGNSILGRGVGAVAGGIANPANSGVIQQQVSAQQNGYGDNIIRESELNLWDNNPIGG